MAPAAAEGGGVRGGGGGGRWGLLAASGSIPLTYAGNRHPWHRTGRGHYFGAKIRNEIEKNENEKCALREGSGSSTPAHIVVAHSACNRFYNNKGAFGKACRADSLLNLVKALPNGFSERSDFLLIL